jgi:hypothetical protein
VKKLRRSFCRLHHKSWNNRPDDAGAGNVFARGTNIEYVYRISPRVAFKRGKTTIAVEVEYTTAAYGQLLILTIWANSPHLKKPAISEDSSHLYMHFKKIKYVIVKKLRQFHLSFFFQR